MKKQKIYISPADLRSLKKKFNCSDSAICDALHFRRNSLLSQRIRTHAMNFCSSACIVEC